MNNPAGRSPEGGPPREADFTLHLNHLNDLFVKPDPEPFSEHPNYDSGVEQIFNSIRQRKPRRPLRAVVVVGNRASDRSADETRVALRRYCESRIAIEEVNIACHRREGTAKLLMGIGFLAAVLAVKAVLDGVTFGSELVQQFVDEGLTVLAWVMLWAPLALLMLDWWPARRNADAYRAIRDMEIEVLPSVAQNRPDS